MVPFLERENKKVCSLGGEKVNYQYSYTERPLASSGIDESAVHLEQEAHTKPLHPYT